MKKITLSQEQLANLNAFLQRVELKGAEVPAYVDIINTINGPAESEEQK